MASVTSGVLSLSGALMILISAALIELGRRRKTNTVPLLLAPMNALLGLGFAVQGVTSLLGGDTYSWPGLLGTPLIVVGGVGMFVVALIGRSRQRDR